MCTPRTSSASGTFSYLWAALFIQEFSVIDDLFAIFTRFDSKTDKMNTQTYN